ncbi:hypothetical protein BZZ01_09445 [Nostocales cyanobacterium HT-58-2]|nr:hypothetical protein BZZ01_09445 [Nostocales cyanobacterium HT-58-2]
MILSTKTIVLRSRNGEPKRCVDLQVAWSALTIQPPATGSARKQQPIDGWCKISSSLTVGNPTECFALALSDV